MQAREVARGLLDAKAETKPRFWAELADLGWLGLHVDERYGGSGFGLPELVVIIDELGRAVAPGLFVPTVVASAVIDAVASTEQKARLLPGLVDGTRTAAIGFGGDVTIAGLAHLGGDAGNVSARASGDAGVVIGAAGADVLLVAAGEDMLIVERTAAGVGIDVPGSLDRTRRSGRVSLADTGVEVLPGARDAALARARALFAAEAAGGASDCVDAAVDYAKVREQFGRTIASFQAVKHHCANMLVASESAVACVWDAARAAGEDEQQFRLIAAAAATLAFPAYVRNAELNIQVHGGIGFTWEHDAHLHLRRALTLAALLGGDGPAGDTFTLTAAGCTRANSVDLPEGAEALRAEIHAEARRIASLGERDQLDELIATGYLMPHWPRPWGRAAGAVEQLLTEQEFTAAGVKRPDYGITGWVILTLIQHGTDSQIERFVERALRKEEIWCQLFSEPAAGSDAAAVKTRATRTEGGWIVNGQKVWTSGAHYCKRGLATVRTDFSGPKHAGITMVILDMKAPGVEVRPLRQITGGSEFNEVFFNDVFVPDEDVVGEVNAGWAVARATLGNERVSIGGGAGGIAPATAWLVDLANRHGDRVVGTPQRVGRFLAEDHALRLLNLRRAVRSIEGSGPGPEGNITKLKLAEHFQEQGAIAASLLGPEMVLDSGEGALAARAAMGARGMAIAGGTSEIARNQIAERILGMPRDPLVT